MINHTFWQSAFFPSNVTPETTFHRQITLEVSELLQQARSASYQPVTIQELHSAIHASGPWKSPGLDNISNICLRQCEPLLAPLLIQLFTASLRLGYFPSFWKAAIVVAVPKPEGDPLSPKGYRPISLLSCLSKLLERIITNRLTHYLESHALLAPTQFGFRQGRSTEDALWQLIAAASTALQSRQRLVLVSLDIQGAYDTVWHAGLLWKLADFHIPFDLLRWISAYLESRIAHVRVRSATTTRHLDMGLPQGSPLSAILFLVYINDLLSELHTLPDASAQAFADDLISWWLETLQSASTTISTEISQIIQTWAQKWRMVFNPTKCKLLCIGRISAPPPYFVLNGILLDHVAHLRYLGIWLDSTLSWREHIRRVSQRALHRLRLIHRTAGTLWGLHPTIFRHLVETVVFPTLFYGAPIWCSAVRHSSRLAPLDRVIRHCAIASFGLLRTVSHGASQMIAGFLPADLQLRQRVMEYHLRRLTYGDDLDLSGPSILTRNQTIGPLDILCQEIRHLDRHSSIHASFLRQVETHHLWVSDPSVSSWPFTPSILDNDTSIQRIREARLHSSPDDLWIFTDGSVDGQLCGAAALFFIGDSWHSHTFAVRFIGHHSSTQAELVALRLGCQHALDFGHFHRITFICDSQCALRSLEHSCRTMTLTFEVQKALQTLLYSVAELRLWWTPSHVNLTENELADAAAKAAAQEGTHTSGFETVPSCRTTLRSLIRRHYISRLEAQWHVADSGRDLFEIIPSFSRCLRWTEDLHRRQVALTSQFLTGHYATNAYLCRFGSRSDSNCSWCPSTFDDRRHRLFQCPRFDFIRQQLSTHIHTDTQGAHGWEWDFLVGSGRRYLAQFLDHVQRARS